MKYVPPGGCKLVQRRDELFFVANNAVIEIAADEYRIRIRAR